MKKLAIFDMDGTVFESYLNWAKIKTALGIPRDGNILEVIYSGSQVDDKRLEILENYERENTLKARPIKGIPGFLDYLETMNITAVLITNNNRENTMFLLNKYGLTFDMVITREMKFWKPAPDAFLYAMDMYDCKPAETLSIGDSHYDIKASKEAKVPHIFIIKNDRSTQLDDAGVTYFEDYDDLKTILERTGTIDVGMPTQRTPAPNV
jgi:HAD superfamily hydrolase (TIGR01509 family)